MYGIVKAVKKRSGKIEDFEFAKLERTILESIIEEKEFDEPSNVEKSSASRLTFEVISNLERKIRRGEIDGSCVEVEVIQNTVEDVFYSSGYHNTAKKYMRFKYMKIVNTKDAEIADLKKKINDLEDFKSRFIDDMR